MQSISSKFAAQAIGLAVLATLGSSAFAASTVWDLTAGCGTGSGANANNINVMTCATPDLGLTLSGLSTGTGTVASPTAGTNFAATSVFNSGADTTNIAGGMGVRSTNDTALAATGPSAIDNVNGIDALLLTFGSKVKLTNLTIGWNATQNSGAPYTDSDLSLFAWTGSGAPVTPVAPGPIGGPSGLGSGWTLIGNFADVGVTGSLATNATVFSSSWLVSAYSSAYGGGAGLDNFNDAFTLATVTTVPEPGSLALLGAGLLGLLASKRRKPVATLAA